MIYTSVPANMAEIYHVMAVLYHVMATVVCFEHMASLARTLRDL